MALILVVDDNHDLVKTVERALMREGHEVIAASSGAVALSLMQQRRPDVIVLDVVMPDMDGFEVCRQIRAHPELGKTPVLFLTVRQEIEDVLKGFQAGGDDYVTKPFDLRELTARIGALLRRANGQKLAPQALKAGPLTLEATTHQVRVGDRPVQLTPREYELLRYMMEHAGAIVPVERLLQNVWRCAPGAGDPDLVRTHIRNLRLKIEPDPAHPVHIKTVPRRGYLIPYRKSLDATRSD